MDLRQLVRGTVRWSDLESIGTELAERTDQPYVRIEFLEADNWLSTPMVVDDTWFVKVISPQNALVHSLLTGARNLGAVSSGRPGFFQRFEDPLEMGRHEIEATEWMIEIGVNAPEPVDLFEYGEYAIVVLEYLPNYRSFAECDTTTQQAVMPELLTTLKHMHDNDLVHGDLRAENVLLVDEELYFIDATQVQGDRLTEARAYDVACALALLAPEIGTREAVQAADDVFTADVLLEASSYLEFIRFRPDHNFKVGHLKVEIDRVLAR